MNGRTQELNVWGLSKIDELFTYILRRAANLDFTPIIPFMPRFCFVLFFFFAGVVVN